jgi:hypothetical protein
MRISFAPRRVTASEEVDKRPMNPNDARHCEEKRKDCDYQVDKSDAHKDR